MRKIPEENLTINGKGTKNKKFFKGKTMFGYNVLGFGAGGGAKFIAATGGCVAESGNYKVHTFNSPGTFCVSCIGDDAVVSYVVVAGGGGGSGPQYGGGAGGVTQPLH